MLRPLALKLIRAYRYVSAFFPGSCRYYPTCSTYALWCFKHDNLVRAFGATLWRIVRCNPLFSGGIDYPTVPYPPFCFVKPPPKMQTVSFWFVPKDTKHCYLIKAL